MCCASMGWWTGAGGLKNSQNFARFKYIKPIGGLRVQKYHIYIASCNFHQYYYWLLSFKTNLQDMSLLFLKKSAGKLAEGKGKRYGSSGEQKKRKFVLNSIPIHSFFQNWIGIIWDPIIYYIRVINIHTPPHYTWYHKFDNEHTQIFSVQALGKKPVTFSNVTAICRREKFLSFCSFVKGPTEIRKWRT